MEAFPTSAMLHIITASYLRHYRNNQHLEQVHYAAAEAKRPALDEEYFIQHRRKQLADADASSSSDKMTVMQRVHFEQLKTEATQASIHARENQITFWAELLERHPDIRKIISIGSAIATEIQRAEAAFQQLLHINERSVYILRTYANLITEVMNHRARAQHMLDEADEIEDELSRDRNEVVTNVEFLESVREVVCIVRAGSHIRL